MTYAKSASFILSVPPSHQTIRGADELPVEVRRRGEAVGRSPVARAVRATLGGALQQLRWRLLTQPIGHLAEHHHPTIHRALVHQWPRAANHSSWTREQEHAQDPQCGQIRFPHVWKNECACFISKASRAKVQTGYTQIVHLLLY